MRLLALAVATASSVLVACGGTESRQEHPAQVYWIRKATTADRHVRVQLAILKGLVTRFEASLRRGNAADRSGLCRSEGRSEVPPEYEVLELRFDLEKETLPDFDFVLQSLSTAGGVGPDDVERFEISLRRARRTFGGSHDERTEW